MQERGGAREETPVAREARLADRTHPGRARARQNACPVRARRSCTANAREDGAKGEREARGGCLCAALVGALPLSGKVGSGARWGD